VTTTAGGTVTYSFFPGSTCTGTNTVVGIVIVTNGVAPNSPLYAFTTTGSFSWNAVYNGDPNNNGATSSCETLTVNSQTISTVSCGHGLSCSVQTNSTLTNLRLAGNKLHVEATGQKGALGYANVTIPKSAVPNISALQVSVDGSKLASSSLIITSNSTAYFVYFTFTFHSPVLIDIQLTAPENVATPNILGLDPTLLYEIVGALVAIMIVAVALVYRRSRKPRGQVVK
jgi:hypothetical protein